MSRAQSDMPYCLTGTLVWRNGWRFLLLHRFEQSAGST